MLAKHSSLFLELEHFQVRSYHCRHQSPNLKLKTFPWQTGLVAKELQKSGFKVGALCILEKNFASVIGFVPESVAAPKIPIVSNHQSALFAVSPLVRNITQSTVALKAKVNGSAILRSELDADERITTPSNHLIRPGQKPCSLVSHYLLHNVNLIVCLTH